MNQNKLWALFTLSPIELYAATPVINPYPGSQLWHGPVWECMTNIGIIHVGWRKRVIAISWSKIGYLAKPVVKTDQTSGYVRWLHPDDTDQGKDYIHAYRYGDAVNYLAALYAAREQIIGDVA